MPNILLDGSNGTLVRNFTVSDKAHISAENLSGDIALESKTSTGYIPVMEDGAPVVLSATSDNPRGIYVGGDYRVVASSLGATEKVFLT